MRTILGILALVVPAVPLVHAEEADTKMEPSSVLVSYEETRFKNALVKEMKALLEKEGIRVVVSNHTEGGDLAEHIATDYDAVFVTISGVNSKVRPWVVEWLKKNESAASRIILHTTQTREWEVKTPVEVDAITSASANGKVKSLAAEYVDKLQSLLETSPAPGQEG